MSSFASISADSTSAAVRRLDQLSPDTGKRAVRSSPYFVSAFLLSSKAFFVPSKMNFLSVGTDFSSRVLRSPSSVPQITFETFSVLWNFLTAGFLTLTAFMTLL